MKNMKGEHSAKRSPFKIGLRGQQIILFLFVSLMPLFAVSLTIKVLGENALKSSIGDSLVLLAQEKLYRADLAISEKMANIYGELPNITEAVSRSNSAQGKQTVFLTVWARLEDSLRILETYAGYGSEVTITNAAGYVLRSNDPGLDYDAKKRTPYRLNAENWWQRAYNNGIGYPLVADVTYDEARKGHVLQIALPIRKAKRAVGVLRTELLLPELTSLVESRPDTEETYTFLTTGSGTIIAASPQSGYSRGGYEMSDAVTTAIVEAKRGDTGKYHGYESEGEDDSFEEQRVYGWARTQPSPSALWKAQQNFSNWMVFVSRPVTSAYAAVGKLNLYIFYVTLVSAIIVIFIAGWVARRITTPIMQVAHAAQSIGQGEFEGDVAHNLQRAAEKGVDTDTEVGILVEEFNTMRQNLKNAVEELTRNEKKLTTIVENLGEGLIVVDETERVLYVNPVAEILFNLGDTGDYENFARVDTATGKMYWRKESTAERAPITLTADFNVLSAAQRETAQHQTLVAKINESRILRIVASQFSDESHNVAGTVYVFDDITSEYEIDKMKSEFVSLVSHELRTPLTSIIGFISLILDGKTGAINEKQYESLSRAHRQSKRLAELINDLLDVSRIEAGRIEMKQEQIHVAQIAKQRIEELRPQADEKAITLLLKVQRQLPLMIGDADRIGQVFINLIGNAIKFTPYRGKITVKMSTVETALPSPQLHAEVIDTGPGIPPEERAKVFDKFHQLSNIQTRQQGGTGLGLGIAAAIVEAHGGKLWVDAGDNGQGSNFQFFIPLDENGTVQ